MKRTILRMPAVKLESGLSRSTIYLRVSQGLWTKPVSLGARAVGWPSDEIEAIILHVLPGTRMTKSVFW